MRSLSALLAVAVVPLAAALGACSSTPSTDDSQADGATGGGANAIVGGGPSSGGFAATGGTPGPGSGGAQTGGTTSSSGGSGSASGGSLGAGGAAGGSANSSGGATSGSSGGSAAGGTGGSIAELVPLTIFLAGDSTVSTYTDTASTTDQAGWGQMLHELLDPKAKVDNRAIGGRTARRFIDDGALDEIWDDAKAGDALFVQFGTNDGNKTATYELNGQTIPYYLDPNTDFKTYLMQYVEGARSRDVTPVFVTPPPRNSAYCTGGNGTGAHAQAMRDLGDDENVTVLDLNARSVAYLTAICPSPTPEDFFLLKGDGSVDGTHFQENGARKLAGFVASELDASSLPLAAAVQ